METSAVRGSEVTTPLPWGDDTVTIPTRGVVTIYL